MKLIGLFGILLAISPVFAADPGKCAGQVPTMTVEECNSQTCNFQYVEGTYSEHKFSFYRSCNEPPLKEVKCMSFKTREDCLSHSCSWVKTTKPGTSNPDLKCYSRAPRASNLFKVQAPKEITEL